MSQKKIRHMIGCGINSMQAIFKPYMIIYQTKASSDVKIVIGKITYYFEPDVRKMLVRKLHGNNNSTFHCQLCFACN